MIVNEKTAIVGRDVVLVPYRPEHVPTYHHWMLSPELLELTASESLTLEEEYEMQRKWQTDPDKLTFIILARPQLPESNARTVTNADQSMVPSQMEIEALPMIGDVNLFLKGTPEDQDNEVEVEVMIAEAAYRRKGAASSALQLLLHYATSPDGPLHLESTKLVARIGESNSASLRLFEKLSFSVTRRVAVFQEVEMRYGGDGHWSGGEYIEFN